MTPAGLKRKTNTAEDRVQFKERHSGARVSFKDKGGLMGGHCELTSYPIMHLTVITIKSSVDVEETFVKTVVEVISVQRLL